MRSRTQHPPSREARGTPFRRGTRSQTVLLAVCFLVIVTVSAVQVAQVFRNRYDAGDVYPPYSTYRSDPLGTSALFAALDALPDLEAVRNVAPLSELDPARHTLVVTSATRGPDPEEVVDALDRFVAAGGTLVITFGLPVETESESGQEKPAADAPEDPIDAPAEKSPEPPVGVDPIPQDEDPRKRDHAREEREVVKEREKHAQELHRYAYANIEERWGFDIGSRALAQPKDNELPKVRVRKAEDADAGLPDALEWHASAHFEHLDENWRSVYLRDELPVLIERRFPSGGTIVMATDHFFLSNEALRDHRQPGLLAWLFTRHPRALFDETHLGTERPTFIMSLIRRYRLGGVIAAFAVLALLYIWKNASTLVPRQATAEEDRQRRTELGKDAAAALVTLLRRTVPPRDLLRTCVTEWSHSAPKDPGTQRCAQEMARLAAEPPASGDVGLLMRYRALCDLLSRRRNTDAM